MNRTGPGKSVLIVEDDLSISNLMERVIRSIAPGVNLEWATSAEEALKLVDTSSKESPSSPYDLVISDFYLDGPKTGLDFWNIFRKTHPGVPFVLMSTADLNDFLENEDEQSVPFFLRKPFDVGQCKAFLSKFIR